MSVSVSKFSLEPLVVNRYLRSRHIARLVLITRIILILFMALCIGTAAYDWVQNSIRTRTGLMHLSNELERITAEKNLESGKKQRKPDIEQIASKNLFGDLGSKSADQKAKSPKPASQTQLSLVGTFIGADKSESSAIIEDQKKKTQEGFSLNDMVFGEAKLVSILADRVEIDRNGQKEVLKLDEGPDSGEGSGTEGGLPVDEFVVEEGELETALQNLPLLLTQARAVPYFKGGQSVGLRLFAIKTGSLYEKVGLKNGDILKSINGNSLSDITQAAKLFEMLKSEKNITVSVERNREDRAFKYQIK